MKKKDENMPPVTSTRAMYAPERWRLAKRWSGVIGGVACIKDVEPDELERLLEIVLDGLRYQPGA